VGGLQAIRACHQGETKKAEIGKKTFPDGRSGYWTQASWAMGKSNREFGVRGEGVSKNWNMGKKKEKKRNKTGGDWKILSKKKWGKKKCEIRKRGGTIQKERRKLRTSGGSTLLQGKTENNGRETTPGFKNVLRCVG